MARKVETGIIITASAKGLKKGVDGAKKSLKGLRKGLELSGKAVEGFGASYIAGVDVIFKSVEVFKTIQGLLADTVVKFLEASAQFRFAGDSQIKAITGFKKEAQRTLGAFGDIFTAMFAGLSDAAKPAISSLKAYLEVNREMIGVKIVEFLAQTAQTLINVVGPAVNFAYKVFSGFKNIVNLTSAALAGFDSALADIQAGMSELAATSAFQDLADQEAKVDALVRKYAKAKGAEKAEALKQINAETQKTKELRFEYKKASADRDAATKQAAKSARMSQKAQADAAREILQQEKNMEELERVTKQVQEAMGKGVAAAAGAMMKRLREDVKKSGKTQEERDKEREAAEKKRLEAAKNAAAAAKQAADAERRRLEEQKALQFQIGAIMGAGPVEAMKAFANGTKTAGQAMRDLVVQTAAAVAKTLLLNAIKGGVASGALGALTGGALSALGGGLLTALPGMLFNSGGYVKGFASGGGVDSVAARLTPGEFVLPKGLVDSIRLGKAPPKATYNNGGMVAAGASLGPASALNVTMQTFAVPSRGEFRRWYKSSVAPNVKAMRARGQL